MTSHTNTTTTAERLAILQRIRTSQDWGRIPRCDRLALLQELRRLQLTPQTTAPTLHSHDRNTNTKEGTR